MKRQNAKHGPAVSSRYLPMVAALLLNAATSIGFAADFTTGSLKVIDPHTRATPIAGGTAIGDLKIVNNGKQADRLLGATTADADHVEIHQMRMNGGLMQMRPLPDGVPVGPGETVDLGENATNGEHLMLIGVTRQLMPGESVPVTLKFERAGAVNVVFRVEALTP